MKSTLLQHVVVALFLLPTTLSKVIGHSNHDWTQLSESVAFQPNPNLVQGSDENRMMMEDAKSEAIHRMLWSESEKTTTAYAHSMQLGGQEWSSYQLAWHLLGFYVDCNNQNDNNACQRMVMYAVVS